MKKMLRTAAAAAAFTVAGVGFAGVAMAAEPGYVPTEVKGTTQVEDPGVEAVAVSAAGTLPYTGSNSSLPLAEAGVALVAGGGAVLLVVKRRQAAANI